MCWAVLSFTETSWLKALAAGCYRISCMIKQDSGKPYLKLMFAIQQCRQPITAACVCLLLCVWLVSLGLCGGRRFPVIPFMQPKSKPEQLIRREAHPYNPSFLCYTLSRGTWAGSCSECLYDVTSFSPGFTPFSAYLPPGLKSPFPWQSDYPPPFWLRSWSHALEFPPAVHSQERGYYVAILCAACN